MKAKMLVLAMLLFSLSSCQGQEKDPDPSAMKIAMDEVKPKGSWKVNRDYDENGNLISYDSTYTYSYSSVDGDTISAADMDELMSHFQQFLGQNGMNDQSAFMQSFFNDSIPGNSHFFHGDLFADHFNSESFQRQIREMDSLHRQFLKQQYPQFFEKREEKNSAAKQSKNGTI